MTRANERDKHGTDGKPAAAESPFADLESLRLSQDFHKAMGVKKALIRVPVRKPSKQEFFRVRDDDAYRMETGIIDLKEDREVFLIAPEIRCQLPDEWIPVRLVTCITRQGVVFLWPLRLPLPDGRANVWHESALEGARLAVTGWVKVVADMNLGAYQVYEAAGELPDPEWPGHTFAQLLEVAFKDRYIRDMDHPAIQRLLGYV